MASASRSRWTRCGVSSRSVLPEPESGPKYFSRPDPLSEQFELRKFQNRTQPRTHFFEFYWADKAEGTRFVHVLDVAQNAVAASVVARARSIVAAVVHLLGDDSDHAVWPVRAVGRSSRRDCRGLAAGLGH